MLRKTIKGISKWINPQNKIKNENEKIGLAGELGRMKTFPTSYKPYVVISGSLHQRGLKKENALENNTRTKRLLIIINMTKQILWVPTVLDIVYARFCNVRNASLLLNMPLQSTCYVLITISKTVI